MRPTPFFTRSAVSSSSPMASCIQSASASPSHHHTTKSVIPATRLIATAQSSIRKSFIAHPKQQLGRAGGQRRTSAASASSSSSSSSPFPFDESQYHRVQLIEEPYGPMRIFKDNQDNCHFTGVLAFKLADERNKTPKVMEIFVTGDTAINIYTLVNDLKLERPMVHDVMYSILQRAQETNSQQWGLLKVAIVALKDEVFVARLFFGNPLTQEISWDCDCRPSDGCFLSIKFNSPIYIHGSVWNETAKVLESSTIYEMVSKQILSPDIQQQQQSATQLQLPLIHAALETKGAAPKALLPTGPTDFTVLLQDDLEAIKLLKRELVVAVAEEDYATAARIRDHPYMRVYKEMWTNRNLGNQESAARLEMELRESVERNA